MHPKTQLSLVGKQLESSIWHQQRLLRPALVPIVKRYQRSNHAAAAAVDWIPLCPSNAHQQQERATTTLPETTVPHLHRLSPLPLYDFFQKEHTHVSNFTFAHGASGFAKRRNKTQRRPYHLPQLSSICYSEQMGEDAFFRRNDAIGVADGVGGWSGTNLAADPAFFSRQIMHYAYMELERFEDVEDPLFSHYDEADPVQILQSSYDESMQQAQRQGIVGSCTACLAVLRHDELRIANLGDCGISVIRQNDYIFRSEEQQHSFNFPYQLGTGSPDQPKDAQVFNIKLEKNDIIIMGTDGLYDNLFDKEILSIIRSQVTPFMHPGSSKVFHFEPQRLSDALALRAKTVSDNKRNIDSPFQTRAMDEGFYYQGGKKDDISVVVAVVRDNEDAPDRR
ncbi:protein serine/threonine phosphatase 2C [Hesseltinella vesiculosa]|uniref:Protein phosphatase n=1 Tax=Hesseltinella vesiculosa TaxID=101127 RepID=A0A1X2GHW6_9FUNG|nr:protein serine/threonine phosphatase 2C [Hesseltinella vesiculosa]